MRITKKTVAVVSPLALLGVAGVAYAASLGVSSDVLGGGNDTVDSACSIQASYVTVPATGATGDGAADVAWRGAVADNADTTGVNEAAPAGYYLNTVTVTSTGPDCAGSTYRLTVAGTGGQQIAEVTGLLEADGVQKVNPNNDVLVDAATDLYAVVTKAKTNAPAPR